MPRQLPLLHHRPLSATAFRSCKHDEWKATFLLRSQPLTTHPLWYTQFYSIRARSHSSRYSRLRLCELFCWDTKYL